MLGNKYHYGVIRLGCAELKLLRKVLVLLSLFISITSPGFADSQKAEKITPTTSQFRDVKLKATLKPTPPKVNTFCLPPDQSSSTTLSVEFDTAEMTGMAFIFEGDSNTGSALALSGANQ